LQLVPLSRAKKTLIRSLHRRKGRQEEGLYLAEGERLLTELAKNPAGARFLFATSDRAEWLASLIPDADCFLIDDADAALFATEQAQGVGAVVEMPALTTLSQLATSRRALLYLDGIADPGNAGTILRTAEWFGVDGIIFGGGSVDPFNPKAVRATMGAIFHVAMACDAEPEDVMALGLPVIALDAGGREQLGAAMLPERAIYVVGSEAHGISPGIRAGARLVSIGGSGKVESLNAAIAAAILLYEISRSSTAAASHSDRS
jgi:TrmH family RNA methyltransferase